MDEKVLTFNEAIFNITSNFIPHELNLSDDKDPPWFNTKTKSLIHEKNQHTKFSGNTLRIISKLRN